MPKACVNCGTDNRDEALFCRRCGNPFSPEHASPATSEPTLPGSREPAVVPMSPTPPNFPSPAASVFDADDDEERTVMSSACPACGFANRPGAPLCAKCGEAFTGVADASPLPDHAATLVIPRAALAQDSSALPRPDDRTTVAFVAQSGPGATGQGVPGSAATPRRSALPSATGSALGSGAEPPRAGKPIGFWLAIGVAALLLIVAGYWFLNPRAPQPVLGPETPVPPASAPASSAPLAETPPASAATPPPSPDSAPDPAASTEVSIPLETASAAASAAEDSARLAKEKADRLAHAKALREQREQAAAAKKAEQDAAAQRAAEDKALSAAKAATPPPRPAAPVTPSPQAQTAQETCAGRGAIGTAVCESRECGKPEHVNEARCRQVNAEEERRR